MSNAPKCSKCLSIEDEELLFDGIEDKFVQNLKDSMIDETTQLYVKIRETLANVMIKILVDDKNVKRIGVLINEVIGITLQKSTTGPLMLWSIMEKDNTFQKMQSFITKIFTYTHNHPLDNELFDISNSVDKFINDLETYLRVPPYELWFKSNQSGGRKTMRKRGKKKNKRHTISKRIQGGTGPEGETNPTSSFQKLASNEKNISKKESANEQKQQAQMDQNMGAGADLSAELEMQDRYNKFNKKLLEAITERLNDESNKETIMEKMMASCYLHSKENNDVILDSINDSIHESIENNILLQEISPIILTKMLLHASIYVRKAIQNSVEELKKEKIAYGELKHGESMDFNPSKSEFIIIFMNELKQNIKKNIDPSHSL